MNTTKGLGTGIALMLAATATLRAQPPWLELRRVGNQTVLDYHPSPQQGASMLHFSTDLLDLLNNNSQILDVPANSAVFPLDVTSFLSASRGFFSVTEYPGLTAADFVDPEPGIDASPPPYFIEPLAETGALGNGQSVTVHFRLLDSATLLPLSASGSVSLDVKTQGGQPPSFAVTLAPTTLPVINGIVNGTVTVTGTGDFSTLNIAVMSVTLSGAAAAAIERSTYIAGSAAAGAAGSLAQLPALGEDVRRKAPSEYAAPAGDWQHPLRATTAIIGGSFGEWRPGDKPLTPPLNAGV